MVPYHGPWRGAIVPCRWRLNALLSNVLISHGRADFGAAAYILGKLITQSGVIFANNTATSRGGALFVANGGTFEGFDTRFEKNLPASAGPAAYVQHGGRVSCFSCRFDDEFEGTLQHLQKVANSKQILIEGMIWRKVNGFDI